MTSPRTDADHLKCTTCEQTFSRVEHLNRHALIHLRAKGFRCSFCEKTFSRKDALQRHAQIHTTRTDNLTHSAARLRHSCTACAKARVRCSGDDPCQQCHARGQSCQYARRKRRVATATKHANLDRHVDRNAVIPFDIPLEDSTLTSASTCESTSQTSDVAETISTTSGHMAYQTVPAHNHHRSPHQTSTDHSQLHTQQHAVSNIHENETEPLLSLNWLPFADSSTNDDTPSASSHIVDTGAYLRDAEVTVQLSTGLTPIPLVAQEYDHVFRNDRFTDLINVMSGKAVGSLMLEHESPGRNRGTGNLYVHGTGARMSQPEQRALEREHSQLNPTSLPAPVSSQPWWKRILLDKVKDQADDCHDGFHMPREVYQDIVLQFLDTIEDSEISGLDRTDFQFLIEKQNLDAAIQLYLENFHTAFPFLDASLLSIPIWGWALCLATAAMGARFLNTSETTEFADQLCLRLHKKLLLELSLDHADESLPYLQARILIAIGLCHSIDSLRMKTGYNMMALVCQSCLYLRLLDEDCTIGLYKEGQDPEQVWIAWRFRETRRRTGFFIWLIDCIMGFTSQFPPRLSTQSVRLILPCPNTLFKAETWQSWMHVAYGDGASEQNLHAFSAEEDARPHLRQAMVDLQTHRKLPPAVDHFVLTIMIHMLISRVWTATSYFEERFPTVGGSFNFSHTINSSPKYMKQYLGSTPEYVQWRNSTCDSLDILHWDALSQSAKASGLESPGFLQLHLSRLVILAPVKELFDLLMATGDGSHVLLPHTLYNTTTPEAQCRQVVMTWSNRDRYKARLALVHAGAMFWHVRKYAHEVFCQSFTLYLAAICLWGYGMFHSSQKHLDPSLSNPTNPSIPPAVTEADSHLIQSHKNHTHDTRLDGSESHQAERSQRTQTDDRQHRMPKYIQLDRPVDDELVQYFIRSGEKMTIHLEGVDDLCSANGSRQVLEEAATILEHSSHIWTVTHTYASILRKASSMLKP